MITALLYLIIFLAGMDGELIDETGPAVSGEIYLIRNDYYFYLPKEDITAFELAKLLPLFAGTSYDKNEWSPMEGALVPIKDRGQGGMPLGGTLFSLTENDIKELGSAARHLRKLEIER